jgi:uncharacterized protein (DUF488 family)
MSGKIFTIGYEGASVEQVFRALKEAGADALIDVRADVGRRPEFSRDRLSADSYGNGLGYWAFPMMGVSREQRRLVRAGRKTLEEVYVQVLMKGDARTFLTLFKDAIRLGRRPCLLCYERDAAGCHRSLLANALKNLAGDVEVVHLTPGQMSMVVAG